MREYPAGPWRISQFEVTTNGKARTVMAADGYSVALIDGRSSVENHAIAQLIAAAPELYEALKAIKDCLGMGGTAERFVNRLTNGGLLDDAITALAKAEGEPHA